MPAVNWHSFFFLLFAMLSCTFAVAVVLTNNIVRMAVYLVGSLTAVAGLFFLAGADFLGAVQILVYVGGTLVLLAFGVMLTARSPFVSMEIGGVQWVMAVLVAGALLGLLRTVWTVRDLAVAKMKPESVASARAEPETPAGPDKSFPAPTPDAAPTATPLGLGLLGLRVDSLSPDAARPRAGMSGYLLPFEVISVHLVVVLVGAAYLARARRRKNDDS